MKKEYKLYNEESNVNLIALTSMHQGFNDSKMQKKIAKQTLKNTFVVYQNDTFAGYFRESDVCSAGEKILKLIEKNPYFYKRTLKITEKLAKDSLKICKNVLKSNLSKKNDAVLINLLKSCFKINADMTDIGSVVVLSDLETLPLSNKMAEIIASKKKILVLNKTSFDGTKDFSVLGMSNRLSPIQKIKFDLQKVKESKLRKEIEKTLQKNPWIDYGCQGPTTNIEKLYSLFAEKKSNLMDPRKIKTLQKKYKKELNLSKQEYGFFENAQDFSFEKALRVDVRTSMFYCMDLILKEISRRTFYSLNQLRYVFPDEIKLIMKKNGLSRNELDQRRKYSLVYFDLKRNPKILLGDKAEKYAKKRIKVEKVNKRIKIFTGMVAQSGLAKGTVKIINNAEEMIKMKKGDILVAYATTPDLVPAMQKAAAIVTEVGGITCHAAIVSREMGIPCVVGVKHIAKILKDGDRVEVDATTGIIKKA